MTLDKKSQIAALATTLIKTGLMMKDYISNKTNNEIEDGDICFALDALVTNEITKFAKSAKQREQFAEMESPEWPM